MEKKIDYKKIYKLQDEILKIVFNLKNSFYLTGGTALHRFYFEYRYSDDLDFFATKDPLFSESINEILDAFEYNNLYYQITVNSRDFYRVVVNKILKVDFVNDYVYRAGKSNLFNGYKIDNLENILANKVTAVCSRDEEKDVFDLFVIAFNHEFSWSKIVNICQKKSNFRKDYFIARLKIFPLDWLNKIKMLRKLNINKKHIEKLCIDVILEQRNTLYGIKKNE